MPRWQIQVISRIQRTDPTSAAPACVSAQLQSNSLKVYVAAMYASDAITSTSARKMAHPLTQPAPGPEGARRPRERRAGVGIGPVQVAVAERDENDRHEGGEQDAGRVRRDTGVGNDEPERRCERVGGRRRGNADDDVRDVADRAFFQALVHRLKRGASGAAPLSVAIGAPLLVSTVAIAGTERYDLWRRRCKGRDSQKTTSPLVHLVQRGPDLLDRSVALSLRSGRSTVVLSVYVTRQPSRPLRERNSWPAKQARTTPIGPGEVRRDPHPQPDARPRRTGARREHPGALQRLAKRHLWMHFTRMGSYADADVPVIVRGDGCYVYDEHGKRLPRRAFRPVLREHRPRPLRARRGGRGAGEGARLLHQLSYAHRPLERAARIAQLVLAISTACSFHPGGSEVQSRRGRPAKAYFKATR